MGEKDGMKGGFAPLKRETLSNTVYAQIRQAIVSGEIEDGTELNQVDVADRFGISRVPVREALRRLQAERLLTANAFKRYVVTGLDGGEIVELMEVREALQRLALERTMTAIRERHIDAEPIWSMKDRRPLEADADEWLQAEIEFHRVLNQGAPHAAALVEDINVRIHRYLALSVSSPDRRRAVTREHRAILAAVADDDVAAAEGALSGHEMGTRLALTSYLSSPRVEVTLT